MKLLSGSHPLPAWLQGHQGHQEKISPVRSLGTQQLCCSTIFLEDARGWRWDPTTHYMQSHLQFESFVFDAIAGVARILRQTRDKPFRSFSEANKSLAIVGHMLYSVDVCTLCRLCSISTPWEVRAPEQECLQPQDSTNSQAFLGVLVVGLTVATKRAWNSGPPGHLVDSPWAARIESTFLSWKSRVVLSP